MTPKDKAKELVNKYLQIYDGRVPQAKQCALIVLNEILSSSPSRSPISSSSEFMPHFNATKYWNEVKQEIENL